MLVGIQLGDHARVDLEHGAVLPRLELEKWIGNAIFHQLLLAYQIQHQHVEFAVAAGRGTQGFHLSDVVAAAGLDVRAAPRAVGLQRQTHHDRLEMPLEEAQPVVAECAIPPHVFATGAVGGRIRQ